MKSLLMFTAIGVFLALSSIEISAQAKQRVRFAAGESSASVKGVVRGYAYRDYIVAARSGPSIDLDLKASTMATVLSVFTPGGSNLVEAAQGDQFSGTLPSNGDYVIRVGMMRSAARRKGSVSSFTLRISIN